MFSHSTDQRLLLASGVTGFWRFRTPIGVETPLSPPIIKMNQAYFRRTFVGQLVLLLVCAMCLEYVQAGKVLHWHHGSQSRLLALNPDKPANNGHD